MSQYATNARRVAGAVLGALVLAGVSAGSASAQDLPATSGDPRIGLAAGLENAGTAALGLEHLANRPKPAAVNGTNSDLAFQGDYAFNGNYNGINIYNIAGPTATAYASSPTYQRERSSTRPRSPPTARRSPSG